MLNLAYPTPVLTQLTLLAVFTQLEYEFSQEHFTGLTQEASNITPSLVVAFPGLVPDDSMHCPRIIIRWTWGKKHLSLTPRALFVI
ncbi:hypothetical protein BDP81DRAFT_429929 [Colletotrichum phormii]|uniref:Uncharacterized protein n=1 Tax=Colletotrichum phormii TaxID=359342 RepID=A0AAI9ZP98_9PEZI|nr:uncharacterized protein BDP81DRAFT_429929 [Colletotrichum phormii]KAK1635578.1 hypothetical protein BDP81DRAFT_429929 [Colletotrichum phormii]